MSRLLDGIELHPVRIPMHHRFRGVDHREAVLLQGPAGWGEYSPFAEYPVAEKAPWLSAAIELAQGPLPSPGRSRIPVNVTIPAVDPETAADLVTRSGAGTAKVKVGQPGETERDDRARLAAVREALGKEGRIRIDVNGAWDLDSAERRLNEMSVFQLEYAEQPVATVTEMRELRRRVDVPIAADEVVRRSETPFAVIANEAADILVLKVQPMGGVANVLRLAARSPLPVVISSALETSVGMYGGLLAASLLTDLQYACGLGTVSLMQGDPTPRPLVPQNGWLEVRRPEPDPQLLARWHPGPEKADEMLADLAQVSEVLR